MSKQNPSQAVGEAAQKKDDEQDLKTILDSSQRADLTILIAGITESMRNVILDNFSAVAGLDQSLLTDGKSDEEKMMMADPSTADVSDYDRERKLKDEYEQDLSTSRMKALKKTCLQAYDEWREQVVSRVGQVVNSPRDAKDQMKLKSGQKPANPQAPNTTVGRMTNTPSKRSPNLKFKDLFSPIKTPLTKLTMEQRTLILHSIMLLLLSLEHYNAPSRILLLNLTSSLKLPLKTFEQDEYATAKGLLEAAKEMTADEETKKRVEENRESRKWKVGLASVAGAAIIGVTGGLAAPLVAAGVGSVMGGLGLGATAAAGYLGSVAGSTVLVGSLFGAYGGRMTGQMMDKYAREVEDFQFLPVHSNQKTSEDQTQGAKQASDHDHKLRVTVCLSGWLTEKEDVVKPWRVLGTGAEVFALKYELEALLNLGNAMNGLLQSAAWGYAKKELIRQTIFADLAAALWPIGLLKVVRVIDNPFSVAKTRADKVGEVLADALINKAQGERPVSLIGYSLGARAIYSCLTALAKRKAFSLVENVVLIGAPTPSDTSDWRVLRSVVSGRLVNVYSQNDYVLGVMYRSSAIQFGVAGLQKVEGLAGVENVDVSEEVDGHTRYRYLIGSILNKIGFEDINMEAVDEEREALEKMLAEEKKNSLNAQRKRLLRQQSNNGKSDEAAEADEEATEIEKNVKAQTEKSLMTRAIEYFYVPSAPTTKEAQKSAQNAEKSVRASSQGADTVNDTANAGQDSTQSYAQWAYGKLPSMPHMNSPGFGVQKSDQEDQNVSSRAQKTVQDAGKSAQNYASKAAGYLPNMSSLPSMPSISGLTGRGQPQSKEAQISGKETTKGQDNVKKASSGVKSPVQPDQKTSKSPNVPAGINTGRKSVRQPPIIHQDVNRPLEKNNTNAAKEVSSKVVQKPVTPKESEPTTAPGGVDNTKSISESKPPVQSYGSKAVSYLPAMPSISSVSNYLSSNQTKSKSQPPKLEKRNSGVQQTAKASQQPDKTPSARPAPPKLGSRTPSGVKSPPKLERAPSGTKQGTPKLERQQSGMKSPPPKLERLPSGMKSPAPKLERQQSGMKSPPAKLDRTPSGIKSPSASSIAASKTTGTAQQTTKSNNSGGATGLIKKNIGWFR